jgi:hypothetical protein
MIALTLLMLVAIGLFAWVQITQKPPPLVYWLKVDTRPGREMLWASSHGSLHGFDRTGTRTTWITWRQLGLSEWASDVQWIDDDTLWVMEPTRLMACKFQARQCAPLAPNVDAAFAGAREPRQFAWNARTQQLAITDANADRVYLFQRAGAIFKESARWTGWVSLPSAPQWMDDGALWLANAGMGTIVQWDGSARKPPAASLFTQSATLRAGRHQPFSYALTGAGEVWALVAPVRRHQADLARYDLASGDALGTVKLADDQDPNAIARLGEQMIVADRSTGRLQRISRDAQSIEVFGDGPWLAELAEAKEKLQGYGKFPTNLVVALLVCLLPALGLTWQQGEPKLKRAQQQWARPSDPVTVSPTFVRPGKLEVNEAWLSKRRRFACVFVALLLLAGVALLYPVLDVLLTARGLTGRVMFLLSAGIALPFVLGLAAVRNLLRLKAMRVMTDGRNVFFQRAGQTMAAPVARTFVTPYRLWLGGESVALKLPPIMGGKALFERAWFEQRILPAIPAENILRSEWAAWPRVWSMIPLSTRLGYGGAVVAAVGLVAYLELWKR